MKHALPAHIAPILPIKFPLLWLSKKQKKKVYQVDNEVMKDQPKGFYTILKFEKKDITYSDKGFDKVIINFVGIKTAYLKCHTSFPSKSKLHKHIKASCIEENLLALFAQLFSSISVIVSKAMQQFLGSGLIFKGWTYAITSIIFIPKHLLLYLDLESITCFDTDCRVTLINKD